MSQNIEKMAKQLASPLSFLGMGMLFYVIALFFGVIAKVLFGIEFVSYGGEQVDIVTYIVFGSIDLILTVIQIFGSAILVIIIWCYNFFIVGIIFQFPIISDFLGNVPPISEDVIVIMVNVFQEIKNMLSLSAFGIMDGASDVFEGVLSTGGNIS